MIKKEHTKKSFEAQLMIPCIALSVSIVKKNDDPIISKIDSIPYIDKNTKYPMKNGNPMICVAQLNMDQIFDLLKKGSSTNKIKKYFRQYPQTGILQFYRTYCESLIDDDSDVHIIYIKKYDVKNHDIKKEKKLHKLYSQYKNKRGPIFNIPYDYIDEKQYKNYNLYITDAVFAYDFINGTMQSHPKWNEDLKDKNPEYMDTYNNKDNDDNLIQIGGFPYHIQDDFGFDEKKHLMLLGIVNSVLSFNVAIKKNKLENLNFKNLLFDLSFD